MTVTTPKFLIVEDDIVSDQVCIECFERRKRLKFFNGHGPLCSRGCYALMMSIDSKSLPRNKYVGKISKEVVGANNDSS